MDGAYVQLVFADEKNKICMSSSRVAASANTPRKYDQKSTEMLQNRRNFNPLKEMDGDDKFERS